MFPKHSVKMFFFYVLTNTMPIIELDQSDWWKPNPKTLMNQSPYAHLFKCKSPIFFNSCEMNSRFSFWWHTYTWKKRPLLLSFDHGWLCVDCEQCYLSYFLIGNKLSNYIWLVLYSSLCIWRLWGLELQSSILHFWR